MKTKERELLKCYCEYCNRYLCDAPIGSDCLCPACQKWSRAEPDRTGPEPDQAEPGANYTGPGRR